MFVWCNIEDTYWVLEVPPPISADRETNNKQSKTNISSNMLTTSFQLSQFVCLKLPAGAVSVLFPVIVHGPDHFLVYLRGTKLHHNF